MSFSFCSFIIVKGWVLQISKRVDSNTPIPQLSIIYIFLLYELYLFQIPPYFIWWFATLYLPYILTARYVDTSKI